MSHLVTVMALNVAPMSPNVAVMSQSASRVPKLKSPNVTECPTYDRILGEIPLRGCLKRVQNASRGNDGQALTVMIHDAQSIPQRPKRPGMATAGTAVASSQAWRPVNQVPPTGGSQRYSLCAAHRMRLADAPPRSAPMADHVPLLPHLAAGWGPGSGSMQCPRDGDSGDHALLGGGERIL